MAWIYLAASQDSAETPWENGSKQSPIVKTTDMLKPCFFPGWHGGKSTSPPSTTTSKPCGEGISRSPLTSSSQDFPARTSALQDAEKVWRESEADFSSKSLGLLGRYDPDLSFWKTLQVSLFPQRIDHSNRHLLELWRQKWPRFGMTVDGECFQLSMWERLIFERGGGAWPTPLATDASKNPSNSLSRAVNPSLDFSFRKGRSKTWPTPRASSAHGPGIHGDGGLDLQTAVKMWPTPTANRRSGLQTHGKNAILGLLNPRWVEWLMGFPQGITKLSDWALAWFRSVRGKRSKD